MFLNQLRFYLNEQRFHYHENKIYPWGIEISVVWLFYIYSIPLTKRLSLSLNIEIISMAPFYSSRRYAKVSSGASTDRFLGRNQYAF